MTQKIFPFLMFQGRAEEAMNFYTSLFPNAEVVELIRYGAGQVGREGTVMKAAFVVGGQRVLCTDSPTEHAFTFTPASSLFVTCETEYEIHKLSSALGEGGRVLMPLASYGFSRQFTWVDDKFGVSWQLNLV